MYALLIWVFYLEVQIKELMFVCTFKGLILIFPTITMTMSRVRGRSHTFKRYCICVCVCLAILRMDHTVRIYFPCHLSICEKWIFFLPQQNRKVTYQSIYQATHLCIDPTKELPLCGTNYLSAKLISVYLACLISTYVIQFPIYN